MIGTRRAAIRFAGVTARWLLPATLAVALNVAAAPAAPSAGGDKAAIAKLEQRWLAAVAPGGDRSALQAILADDFVDIDWRGRIRHKADLIAAPAQAHVTQHVTDLHIRVWQDTGIATGVNHVRSTHKGWSVAVSFTDVFVRSDGRWRAVSAQETVRKPPGS